MTLATYLRVLTPRVTPRAVFDHARSLIGATDKFTWQQRRGRYDMDLSQGLPALMDVRYGIDGPSPEHSEHCEEEERARPSGCWCGPQYLIQVRWDTAYGYREGNGATCNDLHGYLVKTTGEWLDRQGVEWAWMTDTWGDWHHGWTGVEQLGDPRRGAPVLPVRRELLRF